jgi:hypothetical protein
LYVFAHELGHLQQQAAGALDEELAAAADKNVRVSVLKMCRHADELTAAGFRLMGGYSAAVERGSEQRSIADRYRAEREQYEKQLDDLFGEESRADAFAEKVAISFVQDLKSVPLLAGAPPLWLETGHILSETIAWMGLHNWFAELHTFLRKTCNSDDVRVLQLCPSPDANGWLGLGRIFGDVHRPQLLRAFRFSSAWLSRSSEEYAKPATKRTIWPDQAALRTSTPSKRAELIWEFGELQRHMLISMLLDVPVKVSFVGCTAGWQWFNDQSGHNNDQAVIWDYFRLEDEMRRLVQMP